VVLIDALWDQRGRASLAMIVYDSENTVKEIWYKGKITGDAFTVEAMTIFGRN
jgi:hypothetical protein